jgi:hypothetical protein
VLVTSLVDQLVRSKKVFHRKKGKDSFVMRFYGCFLSIYSTTRTRTMMIRTKSPAIAGIKYWSAMDTVAVGAGACVAAGSLT